MINALNTDPVLHNLPSLSDHSFSMGNEALPTYTFEIIEPDQSNFEISSHPSYNHGRSWTYKNMLYIIISEKVLGNKSQEVIKFRVTGNDVTGTATQEYQVAICKLLKDHLGINFVTNRTI
jgi:hypothetical protein